MALVCRAQWMEVCGSERLTGAILDRLTHRGHILEANGESYRLRDAKRRQKRRPPENRSRCPDDPSPAGHMTHQALDVLSASRRTFTPPSTTDA